MGECKTLLVAWKWIGKDICNVISSRVRWMYMLKCKHKFTPQLTIRRFRLSLDRVTGLTFFVFPSTTAEQSVFSFGGTRDNGISTYYFTSQPRQLPHRPFKVALLCRN